jgi:drug/metabolite transporter (DMT)-like permease
MTLSDFLVLLSGVGVIAAVSWVIEYFGWFQSLEAKKKQLFFFVICVVVALAAYCIKTFVPVDVLEQIAPFFELVAAIFAYLFLGEKFHASTKVDKTE